MIDITSADGSVNLILAKDAARVGYVTISVSDTDGDLPDTDFGSFPVLDLIRILKGLS